jgi:hypothetical protein
MDFIIGLPTSARKNDSIWKSLRIDRKVMPIEREPPENSRQETMSISGLRPGRVP